MADEKKTLEMRVAELENKLAQVHITEEEMATYNKVAAKLGAAAPTAATSAAIQCYQQCIPQPISHIQCIIRDCIRPIIRNPIYWADCIQQCFSGGGTGGVGGGGFGGLGGG
jgi:hypothetical protein